MNKIEAKDRVIELLIIDSNEILIQNNNTKTLDDKGNMSNILMGLSGKLKVYNKAIRVAK